MTGRARLLMVPLLLALWPVPAAAVQPDEVLADPVLEQRARDVSKGLRCLVCRNESIDESNAGLARDLRLLVRERLLAGDDNDEVVDFIVDRYGEYVLLRPTLAGSNLILWIAGPAMLLLAGGIAVTYLRKRRLGAEPTARGLSDDEATRLREILGE